MLRGFGRAVAGRWPATKRWLSPVPRPPRAEPQQVEQVYGRPTWAKIRSHPFLWYRRFGSYTFALCFGGNVATLPFTENSAEMCREHPQWMCAALLAKSLYFAVIWPAFLPSVVFAPRKTLVLGGGLRSLME